MSVVDRSSDTLKAAEQQRKLDAHTGRGFCIECRHSAMMHQLGSAMLVCRRNPPRMSPMPGNQPGSIQFTSLFPPVDQTWTCGEFSPAAEAGNGGKIEGSG